MCVCRIREDDVVEGKLNSCLFEIDGDENEDDVNVMCRYNIKYYIPLIYIYICNVYV